MRSTVDPQDIPAPPGGRARPERGAAALVVVLLLFFVLSLVAAYTSRNLIFEQRTSVNQYRSSMAFEAADAGLEWAVAMLNAGRIDDNCTEAGAAADSRSFRQRYLAVDTASGQVSAPPRPDGGERYASCVWSGSAWTCHCPTDVPPSLVVPGDGGLHPAFAVRFTREGVTRPGVVRIDVNGCVRMADSWAVDRCRNDFSSVAVDSEGRSQHTALLALKGALTTLPAAAVTVVGTVPPGTALRAENTSADSGGLTVHAAGAVDEAALTLRGVPGTPAARSVVRDDAGLVPQGLTLADLDPTAPPGAGESIAQRRDRVFASFFGLLSESYRGQPAALPLDCPAAGCSAALAALAAAHPGRVIWVTGDLRLEAAGDIGAVPNPADPAARGPVMVVVERTVRVDDPLARIVGAVHVRNAAGATHPWRGAGQVRGALVSESSLSDNAAPAVVYDPAVLAALRRASGSWVRLPGDWRDYKDVGS